MSVDRDDRDAMSDTDGYSRDEILTGKREAEATAHLDLETTVPDFGYSPFNRTGDLYCPVLDDPEDRPDWPDDAEFAVCLTHDVDFVTEHSVRQSLRKMSNIARCRNQLALEEYVTSLTESALKVGYDVGKSLAPGSDPLHQYERWLEVESDVGAFSTFFFMADERGSRHYSDTHYRYSDTVTFDGETITVADMIREIDRRGWEIGLHPTWPSYDDPEELRRQKERLESVVGHEIESVRQHYLHYDITETPRAHADAGFKYDSTLGFNDNVGFRFGTSYPWNLYDLNADEELSILEMPLIIQDKALLNSSKGLRLDEDTALEYVQLLTERIREVGGVLTLLWHPSTMVETEWWNLYSRCLEYLQKEGAWFGSVREIGDWWKDENNTR